MFLTATNLYSYLEDVGLASPLDMTGGELTIFEVGRRNRNFRVCRRSAPSLFVKQVPAFFPETQLSFLREAACAQLASQAEAVPTLAMVMPKLVRYDPKHQVLVHELIPDARSIADLLLFPTGVAADLMRAVAATIARIHAETAVPGALGAIAGSMTGEPPWVFEIPQKGEILMPNMSAACREIVAWIRARPDMSGSLAAIGARWRRACLIHGDFKWDNILVVPASGGAREIRFVDWELANAGDPLWDVAGIMGGLLQIWLLGKPVGGDSIPSPVVTGAVPIDVVRSAASGFWQAYLTGMGLPPQAPREAHLQLAWLTGARMVLMAFELAQRQEDLPREAGTSLELAQSFLSEPEQSLAGLLGIDAASPLSPVTAPAAAAPLKHPWRLEPLQPPPSTGAQLR